MSWEILPKELKEPNCHLFSFVLLCRLDRELAEHKLSPLKTVCSSHQQKKALSSHQ